MKQYTVKITNKALSDMEDIYDYIADVLCSPATAMNQYDRISKRVLDLETIAETVKLFDTEPERTLGLRKILADNYTVVYVVRNDVANVIRVLYSRRDILTILREEGYDLDFDD